MRAPGYNIRILREQMGLSQRALASAAEMDVAALSRLEAGKSDGRRSTVEKIAKVLAVSIEVLYATPSMVEAAALRMRNVPILSAYQIASWIDGTLELNDTQKFLHADLKRTSRAAFAYLVADESNAPTYEIGDHQIFDPSRQPGPGFIVLGQDPAGRLFTGRFRPLPAHHGKIAYEIVPIDPIRFPIGSSDANSLTIRGTLIEHRRYL